MLKSDGRRDVPAFRHTVKRLVRECGDAFLCRHAEGCTELVVALSVCPVGCIRPDPTAIIADEQENSYGPSRQSARSQERSLNATICLPLSHNMPALCAKHGEGHAEQGLGVAGRRGVIERSLGQNACL
eukprot:6207376-Pleurochrysis_carterae.AAC.3